MKRNTLEEQIEILTEFNKNGNDSLQFYNCEGKWVDRHTTVSTPNFVHTTYRIKPPSPAYRPFTQDELEDFIHGGVVWVRERGFGKTAMITSCSHMNVRVGARLMLYLELFEDYTFLDGTPCGVEE